MFDPYAGQPHRLVLRSDIQKKEAARSAWHDKIKAVEASPEFLSAKAKLERILAQQKSAAARYRILRQAKLVDETVGSYRRKGERYHLTGSNIARAMSHIGMPDPNLDAYVTEIEQLWRAIADPPAVTTGINGLEK